MAAYVLACRLGHRSYDSFGMVTAPNNGLVDNLLDCLHELYRAGDSEQSVDELVDAIRAQSAESMQRWVLREMLENVLEILLDANSGADGNEQMGILFSRLNDLFC